MELFILYIIGAVLCIILALVVALYLHFNDVLNVFFDVLADIEGEEEDQNDPFRND